MSEWPEQSTAITEKVHAELQARRLAGSGFEKMIDEAVETERQRAIERTLEIVHWGDQYRDGGNHPNSSHRRCGLCDRLRESVLDASYQPEAPFNSGFAESEE
jgi:hypothetical protein